MPLIDRVAGVFQRVFACDAGRVTLKTAPDNIPNWDSVGHMNLVAQLEAEFGRQFEVDDIMEMSSVGKIIEILRAKGVAEA